MTVQQPISPELIYNTQKFLLHPIQYALLLLAIGSCICSIPYILTGSLVVAALYFEMLFHGANNGIDNYFKNYENVNRLNHYMPQHYSFLTRIGLGITNTFISAVSKIPDVVDGVDQCLRR